jgi:UDP-2-acetamido-3-amino-2,3-dideoxy-glucuronate N-acetyltransferase
MTLQNQDTAKKTIREVKIGKNVKIYDFVNLYECELGDDTQIGTFVEIQKGVKIGKKCRIQSHTFICEGVTIEDEVFVGHGVMFINDKKPSVKTALKKTWTVEPVLVKKGVVIGTGAVILGGITIGEGAFIGAGAVVTKDVKAHSTVVGNPAYILK